MKPDFNKGAGLLPAIIQDDTSSEVLMLGYMNEESFRKTVDEGKVCFYSRSKKRLWTKGESSGNFLYVRNIKLDCDNDSILIKVKPAGPVCHTGSETCFGDRSSRGFLYRLEDIINSRIEENNENSYTNSLFRKGINKVAQKLGEEAVELIIEAKDDNRDLFENEAADLLYHLLILLRARGVSLESIEDVLKNRHR
ncbi:MAG: bifunctional phosphoribosyl-AMP cyclohydrolase/phosphoribosyl-ATP diphosphatase HisIE [Marinilabiliaceae bacterium]|jgi:phosphoribosyl-ATP pyrophosphohydrolase/phosphoribosyl-AMP cyclohydrolase|nr:bifunctional phosphoribosyl-AMP cyclohydrolase/phosphoribosyl-ATP diphosphatase HisIE [Marinilabiliaceae bacterium]